MTPECPSRTWLLFLGLLLAGVIVFIVLPALVSLVLSFYEWPLTTMPRWVGPAHYKHIFGIGQPGMDPLFRHALFSTLILALVVPCQVLGSFLLACLLSPRRRHFQLLRLVVFFPTLVSPVALYIMWRFILNPGIGPVAQVLGLVGITLPDWLGDPSWARLAVMLVIFWETVGGFQMLFFLAGLRQIPRQVHDMAHLDGMGPLAKFKEVYWPWLKHLFLFNLCLGFLGALQGGFEVAYIMTGGGPLRGTTTLSYYLFENAFQWQRVGYGAAIGILMFILVVPFILGIGLLRGNQTELRHRL